MRHSVWALAREGLRHHSGWGRTLPVPDPRARYDVVVVGAGGHGLATAYYLGRNHGITNVAVLEKGWLGGGNTGRNTTIIRSNYLQDPSAAIYEKSRALYETLSQELNYNVMFSPRGVPHARADPPRGAGLQAHRRGQRAPGRRDGVRGARARQGALPHHPRRGAALPGPRRALAARGGTARHDAVAWGYARACAAMGMHVIQKCEVTGVTSANGQVTGVETTRGPIACGKLALVVAGHSGVLAEMAGFRLPIESLPLQALVSEPIKPCMDVVVMANTVHGYMSQSDKGEMVIGGGTDGYNAFTQRGSFHHVEETVRALVETFPMISRLKMLRQWGGIVDMTGDRSPIISRTPLGNCFVNCGWGTGGFKAIPGSGFAMAELVARGEPGPLAAAFGLGRFREGRFIDESVAAGVAH
jgi:sarcosine oxidase subunit beta